MWVSDLILELGIEGLGWYWNLGFDYFRGLYALEEWWFVCLVGYSLELWIGLSLATCVFTGVRILIVDSRVYQ